MSEQAHGTAQLLSQAALLEEAKSLKIGELLVEAENLELDTKARLEEIKDELKALGYKRPRVRKAKETLANSPAMN